MSRLSKARALLSAAALALWLPSAWAQDVVLRQTGAGEVRFVGRSFGLPIVSGSFEQIDCKVSVNLKNPEESRIAVSIAIPSWRFFTVEINDIIAVVIDFIADFGSKWIDICCSVITVTPLIIWRLCSRVSKSICIIIENA